METFFLLFYFSKAEDMIFVTSYRLIAFLRRKSSIFHRFDLFRRINMSLFNIHSSLYVYEKSQVFMFFSKHT